MAFESLFDLSAQERIFLIAIILVCAAFLSFVLPKILLRLEMQIGKRYKRRIKLSERFTFLLREAFSLAIWLVAAALVFHLAGMDESIASFIAGTSWTNRLAKIILVWASAFLLVKYFSGALRKFDEMIERVEASEPVQGRLQKRFLERMDLSEHAQSLLSKIFGYVCYSFAIGITLCLLGLTDVLTALLAGAGLAGIIVGFAAKDIFANILGGTIVILERPFKIGDYIEVQGAKVEGTVREISIRSTELVTSENVLIVVPNGLIATAPIMNYTYFPKRILKFNLIVSYGTDIEKATKAILSSIEKQEGVAPGEQNEVVIKGFAENKITLEVRAWILAKRRIGYFELKKALMNRCYIALNESGVETYGKVYMGEEEKEKKKAAALKK